MKDPAVLFYYRDFQHGTRRMKYEEIGRYITLLCEQCDSITGTIGPDIFDVVATTQEIRNKFDIDDQGCYYNVRMKAEIERRRKYSQSRSENRRKKITHEKDMIDISKDVKKTSKKSTPPSRFKKPTVDQVAAYFAECLKTSDVSIFTEEAESFIDYYESNGWKVGKNPMKDYKAAIRNWIKRMKQNHGKKQSNTKTAKDNFTELIRFRSSGR